MDGSDLPCYILWPTRTAEQSFWCIDAWKGDWVRLDKCAYMAPLGIEHRCSSEGSSIQSLGHPPFVLWGTGRSWAGRFFQCSLLPLRLCFPSQVPQNVKLHAGREDTRSFFCTWKHSPHFNAGLKAQHLGQLVRHALLTLKNAISNESLVPSPLTQDFVYCMANKLQPGLCANHSLFRFCFFLQPTFPHSLLQQGKDMSVARLQIGSKLCWDVNQPHTAPAGMEKDRTINVGWVNINKNDHISLCDQRP